MNLDKVDVTNKIIGKYEEGQLNLYMGEIKIGMVTETDDGLKRKMREGFVFENDKIYHFENAHPEQIKAYVENCDGGWC
ncbi:YusG family protein [Alkalihalobacillus sp. 1P02AB]|uniref:YusG family protein n=1 Tax=Alkalihalobacillus sp. 1P02AB TaxID=3132260 RepID=UPI0039A77ACB